jgi:TusA-related sulfurtransferase
MAEAEVVATVDTAGKTCPEPLHMMKAQLDTMNTGEIMECLGRPFKQAQHEPFS